MIIRRATDSDADAVLACLAAAFAPFRHQYTDDAFRNTVLTPEAVRLRLSQMTVFLAVAETGVIAGTIACESTGTDVTNLQGMAVVPEWQGKGVAAVLLEAALAEAVNLGCTRVTLDTAVPLQRAIAFYRSHGFQPTGHVTDFFGMPLHEYAASVTSKDHVA
jgi:GNAT superfamily N-acetyltransferase